MEFETAHWYKHLPFLDSEKWLDPQRSGKLATKTTFPWFFVLPQKKLHATSSIRYLTFHKRVNITPTLVHIHEFTFSQLFLIANRSFDWQPHNHKFSFSDISSCVRTILTKVVIYSRVNSLQITPPQLSRKKGRVSFQPKINNAFFQQRYNGKQLP